jgi:hypothetical protein
VHFPPGSISLVKEWDQNVVIPKIRKVSTIRTSLPLVWMELATFSKFGYVWLILAKFRYIFLSLVKFGDIWLNLAKFV